MPAHLSAHPSLSILALGAFQLQLTPLNSTQAARTATALSGNCARSCDPRGAGCSSSPAAGRLRTRSPRARSPPFSAGRSSRTRRRGFACAAPKSGDRRARRGLLRGPRRAASAPAFSTASTSRCALRSSASGSTRTSSCRSTRGSRRSACRPRSSAPRSIDARPWAVATPQETRAPTPATASRCTSRRTRPRWLPRWRRCSAAVVTATALAGVAGVAGRMWLETARILAFLRVVLRRQRRARVVRRVSREARGDRRRGDARSRRRAPRHRVRGGHLRDGGRARGDRGASRVERSFHRELDADPRRRRALGAAILGREEEEEDAAAAAARGGPGAPVAANRGASGIDGIISTAAGYAAGLSQPVTLLIGDVSFQHDSNGLLLLRERPGQPPVTIVVGQQRRRRHLQLPPRRRPDRSRRVHEALRDAAGREPKRPVRRAQDRARASEHAGGVEEGAARGVERGKAQRRRGVDLPRVQLEAASRGAGSRRRGRRARRCGCWRGGGGAAAAAAAKAKATPRVRSAEVTDFTLPAASTADDDGDGDGDGGRRRPTADGC